MQLNVNYSGGGCGGDTSLKADATIDVESSDTIAAVLEKVRAVCPAFPAGLSVTGLWFESEQLQEERTVGSYNIPPKGATVRVLKEPRVPFESLGNKTDAEIQSYIARFHDNRIDRIIKPGISNGWPKLTFEDVKQIFEEYWLNPLKEILISLIASREIKVGNHSLFSNAMTRVNLKRICDNMANTGVLEKVAYSSKAYDYVKETLSTFVAEHIVPVMATKGENLLTLTSSCYKAANFLQRNLKFFWITSTSHFLSTDPTKRKGSGVLPQDGSKILEGDIENILNTSFFVNVKEPLQAKIMEEINKLREIDWSTNDTTTVSLIDQGESYSILEQAVQSFFIIGGVDKVKTYTECIEAPFLSSMASFYTDRAKIWSESLPFYSFDESESFLNKVYASLALESRRQQKCLQPSSAPRVAERVVQLCLPPYIDQLSASLPGIFTDLFNFEKYSQGNNGGMASENHKSMAKKTFEMISTVDVLKTSLCSKVGKIIADSVDRDFNLLCAKFKDPNSESGAFIFDLAKMDNKDTKCHLCDFFISFFDIVSAYESIHFSVCNSVSSVKSQIDLVFSKIANITASSKATPPVIGIAGKSFSEALSTFMDLNLINKGKPKPKNPFFLTNGYMALWNNEEQSSNGREVIIQTCAKFIRHVEEKISFFACLQRDLFFRITDDNFVSVDEEQNTIAKLQAECGYQLVNNLRKNVDCIGVSAEFNKVLKEDEEVAGKLRMNVSAMILNPDSFKDSNQKKISLDMTCPVLRQFEEEALILRTFFKESPRFTNSLKKLEVTYTLGTCDVVWKPKKCEISMSTLQAITMTLFNPAISGALVDSEGYINFEQFDALFSMDSDSAIRNRVVHSLVRNKLLLTKSAEEEPKAGTVPKYTKNCKVKVNTDYSQKAKKLSLPVFRLVESQSSIDIKQDIALLIDCSIVRIMKSRKRMKASELFMEVQHQLEPFMNLRNDVRSIQKRCEKLIGQDFITRDDDEPNVFCYLA